MTDAIKLTNTTIPFEFNGKEYQVKRANLSQIIDFQRKGYEIGKEQDAGSEPRLAAYAIFLVLNAVDKNITEQEVLDNCPEVDLAEITVQLGFMSQQKMDSLQKLRNLLEKGATKTEPEKQTGQS